MATRFEARFGAAGSGFDQILDMNGQPVTYDGVSVANFSITALVKEAVGAIDPRGDANFVFKASGADSLQVQLGRDPQAGDIITWNGSTWRVVKTRQDGATWELRAFAPEEVTF